MVVMKSYLSDFLPGAGAGAVLIFGGPEPEPKKTERLRNTALNQCMAVQWQGWGGGAENSVPQKETET